MSESQLATTEFPKASTALSLQLGLEPRVMIDALKTQFFKGKDATDAQLAVVVSVAKELKLNPLLPGQLYPYPDRNGSVVIMIGPDGIYTMLANNSDIVAQKDGGPAYYTEHGIENGKETCTAYINHKIKGLLKKTIWVDEWVVSSNPNWASRRHHMAEIRALKQAARLVIHGIPADSDEHAIGEMMNVTPEEQEPMKRAPAPKRQPKGAAAIVEAEPVTEAAVVPPAETPKATPEQIAAAAELAKGDQGNANGDTGVPYTPHVAPVEPRAFLKDGEEITAQVEVVEATGMFITKDKVLTASVQLKLKGDFVGTAYHIGGGIKDGDGVKPAAPWVVGALVTAKLFGKLNNKAGGKVQVFCESVESAEGGMEV